MDQFISIIRALTKRELNYYKKTIHDDSVKLRLIEIASDQDVTTTEELIELLNYQKNKSAFYTLKHRLIDDFIQIKLELGSNVVTETEHMVRNLRVLLFSQNAGLMDKSIQQMEKKTRQLELYNAQREVAFCKYLLHYNESKLRMKYKNEMKKAEEKDFLFQNLEKLFFKVVFESLDIFYAYSYEQKKEFESILDEAEEIHLQLKSKTSEFLWRSIQITIQLTPFGEYLNVSQKDIDSLYRNYIQSPLKFRYPNCTFAIQVLQNKYFYLNNNSDDFRESLQDLESLSEEIKKYRMYENVLFYFLYIKSYALINAGEVQNTSKFLDKHINKELIENSNKKIRFYFLYLKGISLYYQENYLEAYSYLLEGRNYKNYLENNNSWIYLENVALGCLIQDNTKWIDKIEYEMELLKRIKKKADQPYKDAFNQFYKLVKKVIKGKIEHKKFTKDLNIIKENAKILTLVKADKLPSFYFK